ncbi:putative phage-associated protein [Bosea sp. AK1]|uniref:Panacea domain-containing protein n=1 Tax=Bosea sp. AK1 TaxID=2587160 RepID=UPI00115383A2|nr:type II toxin-antitoxin system antitoxin SocA domain-containing protein [Bosea sp. AK1]TQI75517.1 putative phage-associated protein [Bosea sp. AK1]
MSSGFDGRAVANYVLDFCDKQNRALTNLGLQKVVYFCHVWSLLDLGRPLIKHSFEAWEYGPVLPYLYREFKAFDRSPISGRAFQLDPRNGTRQVVRYQFDSETEAFLASIVGFYTRLSAGALVQLSHVEGGPWYEAWNHGGSVNPGMKIDDGQIREFYSRIRRPFSAQ